MKLQENLAILGCDPKEAETIDMLKAPVGCSNSSFIRTSAAPDSSANAAEGSSGVRTATPRRRWAAARTSATLGKRAMKAEVYGPPFR